MSFKASVCSLENTEVILCVLRQNNQVPLKFGVMAGWKITAVLVSAMTFTEGCRLKTLFRRKESKLP